MGAAGDPADLHAAEPLQRPAAQDRPAQIVAMVTRLVVAQATLSAAISVFFKGRNMPWTVFTVLLAIGVCCLAAMVRSGSHSAWVVAVSFETFFGAIGLYRFVTVRYLGGTLFALIALGVLAHPSVISAFGGATRRSAGRLQTPRADPAAEALAESAPGPIGSRTVG
ncbi:MAG TPA: hypothetical protein VGI64_04445 [Streptosporangiaceae bacterium]|jgi:hypothetical protein